MTSQSPFRHYARVMQHFASTRALEVLALQASPILGSFLGGFSLERSGVIRLGLLLLGSLALTAHVFVFNDWAGHSSDIRDPRRATLVFARRGISRRQVARVAIALLILANVAFAAVGRPAILLGAAIAALSLLYSCSPSFGKSTPIVASINHLLGGALHFLLGYTLFHALDASGLVISLFFGLVFAGGHLNQEVRDYEGDLLNGIRTSAVVFGCRRTFLASLCHLYGRLRDTRRLSRAWHPAKAVALEHSRVACCMSRGLCERSGVDWDSRPRYGCNDGIDCYSRSSGSRC